MNAVRKMNPKKLLYVFGIVIVVIVAVGIATALWRQGDGQGEKASSNNSQVAREENTGTTVATYGSPLQSEGELQQYSSSIEQQSLTILNEAPDVDWEIQDLVPVDYYLSPGSSTIEIIYVGEDVPAAATVREPADGCAYVAAQFHHYSYVAVDKGDSITNTMLEVVYVDNPNGCPEL